MKTKKVPLPKGLRTKWLKALRSGKYKQAKEVLYDPITRSFCCLGVMEHIALNGEVEICSYSDDDFLDLPSSEFSMNILGCKSGDELNAMGKLFFTLSKYNDKAGLDFEQIADKIEALTKGV